MILALDTETTGVDFNHGSRPFVVTACDDDGRVYWWEWSINPQTRMPRVPPGDLVEVMDLIKTADTLVLQNAKFDIKALGSLDQRFISEWPWKKTRDTTIYAHLLDSKAPKNLTALALRYAHTDISAHEERLGEAVKTARRLAKKHRKSWRLAKAGLPEMPSVKGQGSRHADYWVPSALYASVERLGLKDERYILDKHPEFKTVLMEYAKWDPQVTLAAFLGMSELVKERGLEKWVDHRHEQLPVFARMEYGGVTVSRKNIRQLTTDYGAESERGRRVCTNIAKGMGFDLTLPANGVNKSLQTFCYDTLKLEPIPNPKSKTKGPSLNKNAIKQYLDDLNPKSKAAAFLRSLQGIRQRDTAVSYMKGYARFKVAHAAREDWWILYPSINMTGTATLRGSSSNPNEQNISKQENFNLRYCFGPAPGREWWSMDAKNLELRLPAYEAGEQQLIDLFEKPDEPPFYGSNHMVNFAAVYPDLWERAMREHGPKGAAEYVKKAYKSDYYQWCKNGWFAIQYGAVLRADGWGTADRAFHKQGAHTLLFSRLNKLGDLNRYWIDFAKRTGIVETMIDRTVDPTRGYPLVVTRNHWGGVLETVPLSYHTQGTAMQWTNKGMWRCDAMLLDWQRSGFDARLIMQVHDEVVFDMPKRGDPRVSRSRSNLPRAEALARQLAKSGDDIGVPTPVGIEYHPETYSSGISF